MGFDRRLERRPASGNLWHSHRPTPALRERSAFAAASRGDAESADFADAAAARSIFVSCRVERRAHEGLGVVRPQLDRLLKAASAAFAILQLLLRHADVEEQSAQVGIATPGAGDASTAGLMIACVRRRHAASKKFLISWFFFACSSLTRAARESLKLVVVKVADSHRARASSSPDALFRGDDDGLARLRERFDDVVTFCRSWPATSDRPGRYSSHEDLRVRDAAIFVIDDLVPCTRPVCASAGTASASNAPAIHEVSVRRPSFPKNYPSSTTIFSGVEKLRLVYTKATVALFPAKNPRCPRSPRNTRRRQRPRNRRPYPIVCSRGSSTASTPRSSR